MSPDAFNPAPGLVLTLDVANYMSRSFQSQMSPKRTSVPFPSQWTIEFLAECDLIVDMLLQAFRNQKKTTWDAKEYAEYLKEHYRKCSGRNDDIEAKLLAKFPPIHKTPQTEGYPCTVVDVNGNLLVWYLPRVLTEERQHRMWQSLQIIEGRLKSFPGHSNWRLNRSNFRDANTCMIKPGTNSKTLEVSKELRTDAGLKWVQELYQASALIGGALSVMHPALFRCGIAAIDLVAAHPTLIAKNESLAEILAAWSSPFIGISVMNNRQTPVHRDNGAAHLSMDILATVGPYLKSRMQLPGLGYEFEYESGTIVGVTGRVVAHGASAEGERACFAYYFRQNVFHALGVKSPDCACASENGPV